MTYLLCVTQAVLCSVLSQDCTDIVKHGQMKGVLIVTRANYYVADFTEDANYHNFEGDFENVEITKNKCIIVKPEVK